MVNISFGVIVLNGEPFTRYTLRALYPFAHEIIVVEGAAPASASVATADGHSTDGTLDVLRRFKAEEDPDDKVQIVMRDGFWEEKDAMSQAYAARATGDYLWQVDIDEFYQPDDMRAVINMLRDDPTITAVSFKMLTFWGAPDVITDGWYLRRGANIYHRLFKWGPGYTYATHRPPTVVAPDGMDTRRQHWVTGHQMARRSIQMYHYSLLFPKQVTEKAAYYSAADWVDRPGMSTWAERCYMALEYPFRVHNVYEVPSWLERFRGEPPPQVAAMWEAVQRGEHDVSSRPMDDVERLLLSPGYQLARLVVKWGDYGERAAGAILGAASRFRRRIMGESPQ